MFFPLTTCDTLSRILSYYINISAGLVACASSTELIMTTEHLYEFSSQDGRHDHELYSRNFSLPVSARVPACEQRCGLGNAGVVGVAWAAPTGRLSGPHDEGVIGREGLARGGATAGRAELRNQAEPRA